MNQTNERDYGVYALGAVAGIALGVLGGPAGMAAGYATWKAAEVMSRPKGYNVNHNGQSKQS